MNKRKWLTILGLLCVVTAVLPVYAWWGDAVQPSSTAKSQELGWENLVPSGYIPPENPLQSMTEEEVYQLMDGSDASEKYLSELEEKLAYAPVVPELDGKRIKIPGYVVPLEFDGQTELTEFLLVPYYGACIHTPPPPANQVILVHSERSLVMENPYDPIWVIGTLKTETVVNDMAEAGYTLEIDSIQPYDK